MRWTSGISLFLILTGAILLACAAAWPVYTDPNAPTRISDQLWPEEQQSHGKDHDLPFREWFARLHAYETPHKMLSDLGRGVATAGLGLFFAGRVWSLYQRQPWMRTDRAIFILWLLLWAVRYPLSIWYYGLREDRFDYPVWGDSIGLPIAGDFLSWTVGAVLSSLLLGLLARGRHYLPSVRIPKPVSIGDWLRTILIAAWIAFLALSLYAGIPDGDEGVVFTSILAPVVLIFILSAQKIPRTDKT